MSIVGHKKGAVAATLVVHAANPAHMVPEHPYDELRRRRTQAAQDRLELANSRSRQEQLLLSLWSWRDRQAMFGHFQAHA